MAFECTRITIVDAIGVPVRIPYLVSLLNGDFKSVLHGKNVNGIMYWEDTCEEFYIS